MFLKEQPKFEFTNEWAVMEVALTTPLEPSKPATLVAFQSVRWPVLLTFIPSTVYGPSHVFVVVLDLCFVVVECIVWIWVSRDGGIIVDIPSIAG